MNYSRLFRKQRTFDEWNYKELIKSYNNIS